MFSSPDQNMPSPLGDVQPLINMSVDAIRQVIAETKARAIGHTFYAYVLTNDNDLVSLGFHMHSEQRLETQLSDATAKGYVADGERGIAEAAGYRWGWYEWHHGEYIGNQDDWHVESKAWLAPRVAELEYAVARGAVNVVMTQIMRQLDISGAFGTEQEREHALAYLGFYDSSSTVAVSSAELMNPPAAWERYGADFVAGFSERPL